MIGPAVLAAVMVLSVRMGARRAQPAAGAP
jgi:hypothetical protein